MKEIQNTEQPEIHICKNCGTSFQGKFCNACGQKVYGPEAKKISNILEEGFHFITHWEGTFLTNLKMMFTRPGKISEDYCNGIRKKYFKPISFFLFIVILYLLFPLFNGLNMKLGSYLNMGITSGYYKSTVESVMQEKGLSLNELSAAYEYKGAITSKFLLITLIPVIALLSLLMGYKKRKYYFDHFIFATETLSFFILFGFLIFPVLMYGISSITSDSVLKSEAAIGLVVSTISGIYIFMAARRFFKFSVLWSLSYTIFYLLFFMVFLQFVYKFILFTIAINSI